MYTAIANYFLYYYMKKTRQEYLKRCGRILYADVMLVLTLVAVILSNCCEIQNDTLLTGL